MKNDTAYIIDLSETDSTMTALVGGKGANLGALSQMEGIHVPDGFCVSTAAFKKIIAGTPGINTLLDQLADLKTGDGDTISQIGAALRRLIETVTIPGDIRKEVCRHLSANGENNAYAIRSSATAEDLPGASFAGQQDTYLNIIGEENILQHISKCWASLFTDRAIIYRLQNGFHRQKISLSVIVQKMVFPQAAGILFTADPVTGNRKISSVDAGFGLGEAMVSGLVNADVYKVRDNTVTDKKITAKKLAVYALQEGGTKMQELEPELQRRQVLTDEQILQLEDTGRKIETNFGCPQDIEWCLADDTFYIVQSRPITTLYPIPEADDQENHVYVSVGHQQMMTDPIKPLGLSIWQLSAARPMYEAGGRLFVDVAPDLATPAGRAMIVNVLGKSDPFIKDALTTILERGNFIKPLPDTVKNAPPVDFQAQIDYDPTLVSDLIKSKQAAIAKLKQDIQAKSGTDLFDFILADTQQLKNVRADTRSFAVIMTGIHTASWINDKMQEWLGEKNAADTLSQSVPNNITSEMGLALLDVADAIRPYPEVISYLQQVKDGLFLDMLPQYRGGRETRDAIVAFLDKYGMRCSGEIDITKTRWSEKPSALIPVILSNIKNFEAGAGARKFEEGRQQALKKEQELITRLEQLPDGAQKAAETKQKIHVLRNFIGYREYPKYDIVNRYFVYKQALMKEAGQLAADGIIREKEDVYYLRFEEFRTLVTTGKADYQLINQRKHAYRSYEKLMPPRVMTSEGEIITGKYKRENFPADAIEGLAVSSGVIEGRARVILNIEDADLEAGDILVTTFTDPSWTPLFVAVKGLVTEVGGLMTHGAVIAREYGLPAVVGVEHATTLIKDGQRIRVNGTDGYVEIL